MYEVKVKGIPVRYKNERYHKGMVFQMEKEHLNENLVEIVGEVKEIYQSIALMDMSVVELKALATENDIDLNGATKKDEIIAVIQEHLGEDNGN